MAQFRYRGRGRRGDLVEGALDALTAEAVASQLMNSGITPIDIKEAVAQLDVASVWRRLGANRPPELVDLILLSRQLYSLMRAGVPLGQALHGLARSTRNEVLRDALGAVKTTVESGRELSVALGQHPGIFPSIYVNTVRIGENTGKLDDAFLRLAEYLDRERDTRSRIQAALRYPSFVIIAIGIAMVIINVVVIPQFSQIFARAHVALPLPTKILMGTSDFCVVWWPAMLAAGVAAALGFRSWRATEDGAYQWDRFKLRLPIVGDIINRATLGRFARGFSMSLAAGVPLTQALSIMAQAVDNEYVGERIRYIRNGVERGESLTRTATSTGLFTPMVLQMMAVGEETGAVDDLLAEVAGFYEREVDYDIKNLAQTIEPILIAVLAGFVLLFALGVFLPLWDMATVKMGH